MHFPVGSQVEITASPYGNLDGLTGTVTPKPACIPADVNADVWIALDFYKGDGYNHTPVGLDADNVRMLDAYEYGEPWGPDNPAPRSL